ncbi:BRCT domain-containing protein [Shewanella algicola]|uniref:BRCT domain-containing protein n=1 Tax=Shewanella algicola TaxID=640633 RepID=UPI002494033F|nr:BRCT domain-containing protein [Shewanella algicola]
MQTLVNTPTNLLSDEQLSQLMVFFNEQYRKGMPVISDIAFDLIYLPVLKQRIPNHPLITKVQPEAINVLNTRYEHKKPMLSTLKAYESTEIESFVNRCQQAADVLGIKDELLYRVSPKLDGLAASYIAAEEKIFSRGDGKFGNDISHLYENGLWLVGDSNQDNIREICVIQSYFEEKLKGEFAHPRNFVAGMANSDNLNDAGRKALADNAIHLVFFNSINCPHINATELLTNLEFYCEQAKNDSIYLTDGTVIEVVNEQVKQYMGHNDHNHHWQIAKKSVGDIAEVRVQGVEWTIGRNKITPVLLLEPTWLSGALIKRVTAHHAGNVKSLGLGEGALISMTRIGECIPKILEAIESVAPAIPTHCPCCNQPVQWVNDAITCTFDGCSERQVSAIEYHFSLLNVDLFGRQSVRKLVENGYQSLESIYSLSKGELLSCGFGAGQSDNLFNQIQKAKTTPINDYLILASLGIHSLGRGSSKRILKHFTLSNINTMTDKQLEDIDGFGELTAKSITTAIFNKLTLIMFLNNTLNVIDTLKPQTGIVNEDALPLSGLSIVFTGKMERSRGDMSSEAERFGGVVQSSVTKKTSYLVIGENVGASKINSAKTKGVKIITEADYIKMIAA